MTYDIRNYDVGQTYDDIVYHDSDIRCSMLSSYAGDVVCHGFEPHIRIVGSLHHIVCDIAYDIAHDVSFVSNSGFRMACPDQRFRVICRFVFKLLYHWHPASHTRCIHPATVTGGCLYGGRKVLKASTRAVAGPGGGGGQTERSSGKGGHGNRGGGASPPAAVARD
jgi:hypothetical protein